MYNTEERTQEWIAAACRGDGTAAEALFRQHSPAVFRLAVGLLNDADDAEEVMQDTFVYALRNLRRFDRRRASFRSWLFTIALSRCRNKRRRRWLDTVPLALFAEGEVRGARPLRSVEDWLAVRGVKRELWAAVQNLSPKLREAIVLRFVGALTYEEIGRAAGCNGRAAESRVRTALEALRKQLARGGELQRDLLETLESADAA